MFGKSSLGSICYFITDIDRTERFYRETLGLDVERIEGEAEEGGDWLLARTANGIELIFFVQESRPGNTPIAVFDLPEGGIDDAVATLAEAGATIVTPVSHAPGGWSAEFADPDGHVLSMYHSEELPRQRSRS